MPFDPKFDAVYEVIRGCIKRTLYRSVRVDRQTFTKSIIDKIFEEIRAAKLVVFLAADRNPNAFYECGYAVALNKEIVTLTDTHASLPFDIRDRNAIAFDSSFDKLRDELTKRLKRGKRDRSAIGNERGKRDKRGKRDRSAIGNVGKQKSRLT